jgi:hypothetical protein
MVKSFKRGKIAMSVDPRKLMKLVATKNKQFGHLTPNQEIFLETLHGTRRNLTRKERRVARAKAREQMFSEKPEFEVPEVTSLVSCSK